MADTALIEGHLVLGSSAIAKSLEWSTAKFFRRVPELQQYGIIFKHRKGRTVRWAAWSNLLIRYTTEKGIKGEIV